MEFDPKVQNLAMIMLASSLLAFAVLLGAISFLLQDKVNDAFKAVALAGVIIAPGVAATQRVMKIFQENEDI